MITHYMTRMSDGITYYCKTCGRSVVFDLDRVPFRLEVITEGNNHVQHVGATEGILMGQQEITQATPEPDENDIVLTAEDRARVDVFAEYLERGGQDGELL